ncbi:LytR/AlgR family response regulator transcription factor [Pedobacter sp. AW1-32]|uniref:LytR/AlgR family response regulator transcription factor n=1 Tax=Pedobacter sp. AW1-32 TaxID=3383026 RepID=UPI003FF137A4
MIRCIAVDDQISSLEGLRGYIENSPGLELVQSYTDSVLALSEISKGEQVDIIFLDINMPNISGLELSKSLRAKTKRLIFTTSHQEYAFQAFEAEADAYLLKPYSFAKFAITLNRLFPDDEVRPTAGRAQNDYFLVKNTEEGLRAEMVKYQDIIAFESFSNYVKIHTVKKTIIAYLGLKDVKEQIGTTDDFMQLHRGYIISLNHIEHIDGNQIALTNNLSFRVGESYNAEFKTFLADKMLRTNRKK